MIWISAILAASVPVIVFCAIRSRGEKGIGWQFIRFIVIAISIPILALLALNNSLTGEAATILGIAMAYAFGKSAEQN